MYKRKLHPNLIISELYQIEEPYGKLYGDKKPKGKPRPKRKGSQDRARKEKRRRPK